MNNVYFKKEAEKVFNGLKNKHLYDWNSFLVGYQEASIVRKNHSRKLLVQDDVLVIKKIIDDNWIKCVPTKKADEVCRLMFITMFAILISRTSIAYICMCLNKNRSTLHYYIDHLIDAYQFHKLTRKNFVKMRVLLYQKGFDVHSKQILKQNIDVRTLKKIDIFLVNDK